MMVITRRSFLRSLVIAAPAVVVASRLMPVRGLIMPVQEIVLPEVAYGHHWGRVSKTVFVDGTVRFLVDGRVASREEYDAAKFSEDAVHFSGDERAAEVARRAFHESRPLIHRFIG